MNAGKFRHCPETSGEFGKDDVVDENFRSYLQINFIKIKYFMQSPFYLIY